MALKTKVIRSGGRIDIRAIATPATDGGKDPCPTLKFCNEIKHSDEAELSKLVRLWDDIAESGPPSNDEKFKDLTGTGGLYEMKTTKLRVLCFWDHGSLIVCTHGFVKKSRTTPKQRCQWASSKEGSAMSLLSTRSIFRMTATKATLGSLPFSRRRR